MKPSIWLLVHASVASVAACASTPPLSPASTAAPTSVARAGARSAIRQRLAPCRIEHVAEPLLCGTLEVWENRTTRRGRKIGLHIVVVPALTGSPEPDPVFSFAGGPGDFATNSAGGWAQARELRAHRDVVLVDQRGTGASNRLDCRLPKDAKDVQAYFEPSLPVTEVQRCRAELERTADLTQYTTSITADDIDEVRAWLGYDKINLEGGSYGTRTAQVYLRRYPARVRTATLVGVVGMDQYLPLFHARDGKRALDRLFEACAHQPACAAAFPDLSAEHARVLAGLDRERGRATVESPVDHRPVEVTIPRAVFAEQIRFTLYNAFTASATPYVIHRAAQGDFTPFARLAMLWEPSFRQILAYGMHLSVTCAEDVPFITPTAIEGAIAGTYLRDFRVTQQVEACKLWPRGDAPAKFHQPVESDVPVLLVSGPYDPVTPPTWAEQVAKHLSHGRHVIIPDAHHGAGGLSHGECFERMSSQFIARGTADGLDTSCVTTMTRPAFVTDDASFTALLGHASDE